MAVKMLRHLRAQWEYLKLSGKTAVEYRTNFIVQVTSMILNDLAWIVFWLIIFARFENINGWDIHDMMLLYVVLLSAYGVSGLFYGNRHNISNIIVEGRLDYYLTLPKNILYHVLTSRSSWYDLGDLLLGLVLAVMFLSPAQIPLAILLILLSSTIIISYGVISGSLAFFMSNSEETSRTLSFGLMAFSSYPLSIYHGFTKVMILLIIPAGFVSGVPVELLNTFDSTWLLYMIGFTIFSVIAAVSIFYYGLKKYESGNLLYVRT